MLDHFTVGFLSFVFPAVFCIFYLLVRQLRRFEAWRLREDGPKERVMPTLLIIAVITFIPGSLAQSLWESSASCRASGHSSLQCLFRLNSPAP